MSAATEQQQNNGDVAVAAVEKLAAVDTVKDDLKNKPVVTEDNKTNTTTVAPVAADNGVASKDKNTSEEDATDGNEDVNTSFSLKTTLIKATKRPAEVNRKNVSSYMLFV